MCGSGLEVYLESKMNSRMTIVILSLSLIAVGLAALPNLPIWGKFFVLLLCAALGERWATKK
jgi:hypothetical protein